MPSSFTINPATITFDIESQSIAEDADISNIDATKFEVEGLAEGEVATDIFKVAVAGAYTDAGKITAAEGTYDDGLVIVVKDADMAANYVWEETAGELVVGVSQTEFNDEVAEVELYDQEGATVTFNTTRQINPDTWNVFVLPFETTPAEISAAFGYAAVDVLNRDITSGAAHFKIATSGKILAGEPFIVKPSMDAENAKTLFSDLVFEDVNIVADLTNGYVTAEDGNTYVEDGAGNKFWGTFKKTGIYGERFRYMNKGGWRDASLFTESNPAILKPFRAFVEFAPANADARIYIEEPDGTETAIDAIEFNQMVNDATYTIDGMKVSNTAKKGVYIKNGKKVAVK